MDRYFRIDHDLGAFVLFGPAHVGALALILVLFAGLAGLGGRLSDRARKLVRFGLAGLLFANELLFHAWSAATGHWSLRTMLPLHLCSVTCWMSIVALLRPTPFAFEVVYFLGLTGAGHTLLTPDIGPYGFPHFRWLSSFVCHGGIVLAAGYLTFVERMRPTWASFRRIAIRGNLYLVAVFFLNLAIGSNYMFVSRKPQTASLMDYMGPWPGYVLVLEVVALLHMLALYAPFAIANARRKTA
jgi:hypothetical integral membrane protein (TIGR02206 family)